MFKTLKRFLKNLSVYKEFLLDEDYYILPSILIALRIKLQRQKYDLQVNEEIEDEDSYQKIDKIISAIDVFLDLNKDEKYKELDKICRENSQRQDNVVSKLREKYSNLVKEFEESEQPNILPLEYNVEFFLSQYHDKISQKDYIEAFSVQHAFRESVKNFFNYEHELEQTLVNTIFCTLAEIFLKIR